MRLRQLVTWRLFVGCLALAIGITVSFANHRALGAQERENAHADAARVMALETLWNQAEVSKDARALSQLISETVFYVDIDGSLKDKQEFLNSVKNAEEQFLEIKNESVVVHSYLNTVIVTGVYSEKGKVKGKPYSRRGRFTDTWIKENGAWLCAASQSTLIDKVRSNSQTK